VISNKD